jgi:hypothetical protein
VHYFSISFSFSCDEEHIFVTESLFDWRVDGKLSILLLFRAHNWK